MSIDLCSPNYSNKTPCISKKLIKQVARIINKESKKKVIRLSDKYLITDFQEYLQNIFNCKDESCWGKSLKLLNIIPSSIIISINKHYKPEKPVSWNTNKNTWLSNIDIDNVLNQYKEKYKKFYYFGAIPNDFNLQKKNNCVISELCKFNIKDYINKYNNLGIVFNTDPHTKSGQHWVALYIDLVGKNVNKTPSILYFDSVGDEPSKEVKQLIKKINRQGERINIDFVKLQNTIKHQYNNTECGIYCLHFIINMLKGSSFKRYITQNKNDKYIETFRSIYYI